VFGRFLQVSALAVPIGWRIVKILCQRRRKTTNTMQTTLSAIQAASQTFINEQLYTPLVISRNGKNKQLILLSILALTVMIFLHYKSLEPLKN
jgi:hypothetical protein